MMVHYGLDNTSLAVYNGPAWLLVVLMGGVRDMGTDERKPPDGGRGSNDHVQEDLLIQCWRCRVRLTGPLRGWRAAVLVQSYKYVLCLACRAELARKYDGRALGGGPPFDPIRSAYAIVAQLGEEMMIRFRAWWRRLLCRHDRHVWYYSRVARQRRCLYCGKWWVSRES